jgi:hypothetical protein
MIALLVLLAPVPLELPAKAKAEVLKRVVALSKRMVTADEAADAIKAIGNTVAAQRVLAARYPHADTQEKCAILYVLNRIGIEGAGDALGPIAADFAIARKTHPNDLSFATFYVLDLMKAHAWKVLPEPREKKGEPKRGDGGPVKVPPPTRVTKDGGVTTGTLAERKELVRLIVAEKLRLSPRKGAAYDLPDAADQEWVRVVGKYAFVRLRARSRGASVLFAKDGKGKWALAAVLGHWVN